MGGEVKTSVSDEFKALEVEMALRHEGTIPLKGSCYEIYTLTLCRYGASSEINDGIRQNTIEAE